MDPLCRSDQIVNRQVDIYKYKKIKEAMTCIASVKYIP